MFCPVTNNLPTRMIRATFSRLCAKAREQAFSQHLVSGAIKLSVNGERVPSSLVNSCPTCQGNALPEGLEFLNPDTIATERGKMKRSNASSIPARRSTAAPATHSAERVTSAPNGQQGNVTGSVTPPPSAARVDDLLPRDQWPDTLTRHPLLLGRPAATLTLTTLKAHWSAGPLHGRKKLGTCSACLAPRQTCKGCGVCGTCYDSMAKLSGHALLTAVASAPTTKKRVIHRQRRRSSATQAAGDPPPTVATQHKTSVSPSPVSPPSTAGDPLPPSGEGEFSPVADPAKQNTMANAITTVCMGLRDFLVTKNESYGDSAANPLRIFSQADPIEQINVRIDDKLSRLLRGKAYPGDDTELDLLGYLILKRAIAHRNLTAAQPAGGDRS